MARRRKDNEESNVTFDNAIEALAQGTGFQLGIKTRVLNSRGRIVTPIEVLNILLGGGLPFGTVAQSWGPPKVGKSTWLYQMMGKFQKQYPNGISVIIDNEASADNERITFLGVDISKVLRLPASSIEAGFLALMKMLENKSNSEELKDVPVFVIWDTISKGLAQDNSTQSRVNAMDRARIIKNYMSPVLAEIEKHDFILGLLNQVIYNTDSYGNKHMDSGGGVALKHDVHFSTKITPGNDTWDGNFLVKRVSRMDIDKSKIGPEIGNIPIVLDIREGAVIDEVGSYVEYFIWGGFIENKSGWYPLTRLTETSMMKPYYKVFVDNDKKYRYADLHQMAKNTPEFYHALRLYLMDYLSDMYKLQAKVMEQYRAEALEDFRQYYDHADYYLMDNQEKRQEVIDKLMDNPELLETIRSRVEDCKAICLDCGTIKDDLYPDCNGCDRGELIVSKSVAISILQEIDNLINPAVGSSEEGEVNDGTEEETD